MKYRKTTPKKFIGTLLAFSILGSLSACERNSVGGDDKPLEPVQTIALNNVISSQLAPLTLKGETYLLLASESRGLVLLDSRGSESLSLDGGSVEHFALQRQADGSWLIAVYEEGRGEIQLRLLTLDSETDAPRIHYLGAQPTAGAQVALCFSQQSQRTHLFAIDKAGLGFEYVVHPWQQAWQFTQIRTLYFGEQISSCAVDGVNQRLLVAQPPLGIWSLNADAEKDEERAVFAPAAELAETFGGLWVDRSTDILWLTAGDKVKAFDLHKPDAGAQLSRTLVNLEPVSVAIQQGQLLALGEESESVQRYRLDLPKPRSDSHGVHRAQAIPQVAAQAQTAPVSSAGDAADDPAIWVNPVNPAASLILATDKKSGLNVYTLSGELAAQFPVGRLNNVDLRPMQHGKFVAIAAATNRTDPGISLFGISAAGEVKYLGLRELEMDDPYGLCTYRQGADLLVWVSDKQGDLQLLQIAPGEGDIDWQLRARGTLKVKSQVEGCVVDDERQTLFFGEEDGGIWRLDIAAFLSSGAEPQLVAPVDGERLVADVEGMGLYHNGERSYLVVSSQGNNSYVLFSRDGSQFVGRFRVGINLDKNLDGSSETDGLEVSSTALGDNYPAGILIVQDGRNRMPNGAQNFKLVSWADIAKKLELN